MEENRIDLLLLRLIESDGNIEPLVKSGLEYAQIAKKIQNSLDQGYVIHELGTLKITQKGHNLIDTLNKKFKNENINMWISPEIESQIPQLAKNTVYLPVLQELNVESLKRQDGESPTL